MHLWYKRKLNELIRISRYCNLPLVEAHLQLTSKSVDEIFAQSSKTESSALSDVVLLAADQAKLNGNEEAAEHLRNAYQALTNPPVTDNVVKLNFQDCHELCDSDATAQQLV